MNDLISIIVPTYNRARLIAETLSSISRQTYQNWECIIVDDGSDDDTDAVVLPFLIDARFQYYQRPATLPKGANACRNFGYSKSKGDFVLFFDSDDLMNSQKLEAQLQPLLNDPLLDFTVARFDNFSISAADAQKEEAFTFNKSLSLSLDNYVTNKVFWGTIDFLARRRLFEKSRFNTALPSGQEYYFFISVLSHFPTARGLFIDQPLSLRRIHFQSIQQMQKKDDGVKSTNKFRVYQAVLNDFGSSLSVKSRRYLLQRASVYYTRMVVRGIRPENNPGLVRQIAKNFGLFTALQAWSLFVLARLTGKGDVRIVQQLKQLLQ